MFFFVNLIAFVVIIIYLCVGISWLTPGAICTGYLSWIGHNIKKCVRLFFIWEIPCVFGILKVVVFRDVFLCKSDCLCGYYNLFMCGDILAYTWCNMHWISLLDWP